MPLLDAAGALTPADRKSYRPHRFSVPSGVAALRIEFGYDPGRDEPRSLVTLQLFDPRGFRGAAHRFAPQQVIEIGERRATPGFLAGPMPAGEWMLEVDVHSVIPRADGRPNGYSLRVDAVASVSEEKTVALASAVPDSSAGMGLRHWLRGELHLHSEHSDGRWTTGEMAALARERHLDFMFLTDHNTTSGVDLLRAQAGDAIRVLPGIELTTYAGHALALGAERWIDWRTGHAGRTANDMAKSVHAAGAVFVVAHPDAPPDEVCTGCRWAHHDFDPALADAVEVWGGLWNGAEERNQGCLDLWRAWLNAGHCLTATGATDAHRAEDWEGPVPLTYVNAKDTSLASLLEALRAGRTYVSSGPSLEIRANGYDGPIAGVGERVPRASTRAVEVACADVPEAELRLVGNAGTFAKVRVDSEGYLAAAPRDGDSWCCAELWNRKGDTLLAVTSPMYLV